MVVERETKLVVDAAFRIPPLDDGAVGLQLGAEQHIDLRAHYFDTPDLRLARSGASLRFRSDDAWTLKIPEGTGGMSLSRAEHVFPGDLTALPEVALDLARAWIRTAPVREVAHVERGATSSSSPTRTVTRGRGRRRPGDDARRVAPTLRLPRGRDRARRARTAQVGKRLTDYIRHAGRTHVSKIPKIARALGVDEVRPIDADPAVRHRSARRSPSSCRPS